MNHKLPQFLMVLLLVATLAGCGSTPREQFSKANDAYIAAVETLVEAKQAEVFSDETWNTSIVPAIQAGDAALDEYDSATRADAPSESIARRLSRVLDRLSPYLARAASNLD